MNSGQDPTYLRPLIDLLSEADPPVQWPELIEWLVEEMNGCKGHE